MAETKSEEIAQEEVEQMGQGALPEEVESL